MPGTGRYSRDIAPGEERRRRGDDRMILLWGLGGDSPVASVRTELARMERTALLLDQRAVLETRVELSVDDTVACTVEWNGLRADLERVTAAYLRPYDPIGVPAVTSAGKDSA